MKRYRVVVPFIDSMGSIAPFIVEESNTETKEEYALWVLNRMRDHDGQRPLADLPNGVKFIRT